MPELKIDSDLIEPKEIIPSRDALDLSRIPLVELMRYFGASSKAGSYSSYYQWLDEILSKKRRPYTIVEAGTASGASARAFSARFPEAIIYTLDVNPACSTIFRSTPKIIPLTCDISSVEGLSSAFSSIRAPIDVLIDDASHMSSDVASLLKFAWNRLAENFIYIVEDCDSLGNPGYSQHMSAKFSRSECDNRRETFLAIINDLMHISDQLNDHNYRIKIAYCHKLLIVSRWNDY